MTLRTARSCGGDTPLAQVHFRVRFGLRGFYSGPSGITMGGSESATLERAEGKPPLGLRAGLGPTQPRQVLRVAELLHSNFSSPITGVPSV